MQLISYRRMKIEMSVVARFRVYFISSQVTGTRFFFIYVIDWPLNSRCLTSRLKFKYSWGELLGLPQGSGHMLIDIR